MTYRIPLLFVSILLAPLMTNAQSPSLGTQRVAPAIPVPPPRTIVQPRPLRPSQPMPAPAPAFNPQPFQRNFQTNYHANSQLNPGGGGTTTFRYSPQPSGGRGSPVSPPPTMKTLAEELARLKDEAEEKEAKATEDRLIDLMERLADLRMSVTGLDVRALRGEGAKMKSLAELAGVMSDARRTDRLRIDTPATELYVDEYPLPPGAQWESLGSLERARMPWLGPNGKYLVEGKTIPPDAKWEKLGSMERARMPWLNPDANYLVEGNPRQAYDADGFAVEWSSTTDPANLKEPKYKELTAVERERWRILPGSAEEAGLEE